MARKRSEQLEFEARRNSSMVSQNDKKNIDVVDLKDVPKAEPSPARNRGGSRRHSR